MLLSRKLYNKRDKGSRCNIKNAELIILLSVLFLQVLI